MLSIGLTSFSTKFPFPWITRYSIVFSLSYFVHYSFVFTNMQRFLSSYLLLLVTFSSVADTIRIASVLSFVRCSFVPFTGIAMACTHYFIKCNEEIYSVSGGLYLLCFRLSMWKISLVYVFIITDRFNLSTHFCNFLFIFQFHHLYCHFIRFIVSFANNSKYLHAFIMKL